MIEQILLVITVLSSLLLLNIVSKGSHDRYFKYTFFGYVLTSSLWSILISLIMFFPEQATMLGKLRVTFVCWVPFFLILSLRKLFNEPLPLKPSLLFAGSTTLLSLLILFTSLIVQSYTITPAGLQINKGPYGEIFVIYHALAIMYQLYIIARAYFSEHTPDQKLFISVIFYALVISYCIGVLLAITLPAIFKQDIFTRLSPISSLILTVGLSYSIWRYQIFKIRLIFRESLIFTISLAFFLSGITGLMFIFGHNTFTNTESVLWLILGSLGLTQIFNSQIKHLIYSFFNKDKRAFEDALNYIYYYFGNILELTLFQEKIITLVQEIFKPQAHELVIFTVAKTDQKYLTPDIYYEDSSLYPLEYNAHKHDLAVSLVYDQKLLGFIFLTLDKHYLNYTFENIRLLQIFARQVSIALANSLSYEELKAQQQKLFQSEKIALLGQLTTSIIHELRNPVASLTMNLNNMKQCLEKAHYEQSTIDRLWNNGKKSLQEMNLFMENMLNFSRNENVTMQSQSIAMILAEALPLIRKKASEQNIQITNTISGSLMLTCNAQRIKQVFLNLMLNAIDAMPTGGTLAFTATTKEQNVIIQISDTGLGLSTEQCSKIFTPFFTTKAHGTGLGLAIVKDIIELHHGTISVTSVPSKGTTFTLTFHVQP